jgi:hypothetical protein
MLNFSISAQIKDSIPKDSIVPVNAFQFHMGFDWYYNHVGQIAIIKKYGD